MSNSYGTKSDFFPKQKAFLKGLGACEVSLSKERYIGKRFFTCNTFFAKTAEKTS